MKASKAGKERFNGGPTHAGPRDAGPGLIAHAALQAHNVAGLREAIEPAGARILYLPPDSPAFDPIDPSTGSG